MKRRDFMAAAGAALLGRRGWAADLAPDVKITRVVGLELRHKRAKFAGKNARRDDHGDASRDRILRVYTNTGVDGFGTCGLGEKECAQLLGKRPLDLLKPDNRRMTGPLARFTSPLWDLAGKLLGKPVYELLGGTGLGRVPVYDGSLYFSDLVPQYADRGLDRFKDEVDAGMARGHRAFKVKIGRGARWMPAEEGYARDLAVLRVIRQHAGAEAWIAVDANNGYDPARTRRLLADLPDYHFAWLEEMFPESVPQYLELKAYMADRGIKAPIADGENIRDPVDMKEWVEARAVDVLQGDMNGFGFEGILTEAAMGKPAGATVAPHNWGSLMGFYLQLHAGRAISNFNRAEQDPLSCPALIADGYTIRDGQCSVPPTPGLGLRLDDKKLPEHAKVAFDLKA